MHHRVKRTAYPIDVVAAVAVAVLFLLSSTTFGQPPDDDASDDEVIEYLLRHNVPERVLDEKTKTELRDIKERVRDKPELYVDAIAKAAHLPEDDAMMTDDAARRIGGALGLAADVLSAKYGRALIRQSFVETTERVEALELERDRGAPIPRHLANYRLLRNGIIDMLGRLGDGSAIDRCLRTIESEEMGAQHVMLEYFSKVGRGNAKVRKELERIVAEQTSGLAWLPYTKRVLEEIKATPTTRPASGFTSTQPSRETDHQEPSVPNQLEPDPKREER